MHIFTLIFMLIIGLCGTNATTEQVAQGPSERDRVLNAVVLNRPKRETASQRYDHTFDLIGVVHSSDGLKLGVRETIAVSGGDTYAEIHTIPVKDVKEYLAAKKMQFDGEYNLALDKQKGEIEFFIKRIRRGEEMCKDLDEQMENERTKSLFQTIVCSEENGIKASFQDFSYLVDKHYAVIRVTVNRNDGPGTWEEFVPFDVFENVVKHIKNESINAIRNDKIEDKTKAVTCLKKISDLDAIKLRWQANKKQK